jgi:hypothetical protein
MQTVTSELLVAICLDTRSERWAPGSALTRRVASRSVNHPDLSSRNLNVPHFRNISDGGPHEVHGHSRHRRIGADGHIERALVHACTVRDSRLSKTASGSAVVETDIAYISRHSGRSLLASDTPLGEGGHTPGFRRVSHKKMDFVTFSERAGSRRGVNCNRMRDIRSVSFLKQHAAEKSSPSTKTPSKD